uniref:FRIGIDA-like protein n=1 Tax=Rhizophora mucronata TaxID=61149 RepID=A0A2P2NFN9_RHIMU
MEHATRRDMAKLAAALEFGETMGDMIEELKKNGKEIEAVYFASESGLTEKFPPLSLVRSYLKNSKKKATNILKDGNYSAAAKEESSTVELNSIKAIIRCVEDHKLDAEFPLDSLRKRAAQLEKTKAEKKKSSGVPTAAKPQYKRGHGNSGSRAGGPDFRPSKAPKYSNAYSPFSRRNPAPPAQHSPTTRFSGPYSYPSQSVFETHTPTAYAPTYGVPHTQSPAAIPPQQHYTLPVDNMSASGYRSTGSYGGQTNYGAYDYGSGAPPTYQPSS